MLKHPDITRRRIEQFIKHTLPARLWERKTPMEAAVFVSETPQRDYRLMHFDPMAFQNAEHSPIAPGFAWGPMYNDAWFRLSATVPKEWAGETLVARMDLGAEAIVWNGDSPVCGTDWAHRETFVTEKAEAGQTIVLTVQATPMNPYLGNREKVMNPDPKPYTFQYAELAVYNRELTALYFDMNMAFGVMQEQPADSPRYGQLLYALNEIINFYDPEDNACFGPMRTRLAETFDRPAHASAHQISAIGHAHIDTAWLWPLERTQLKCLHTFATAVNYMDRYPGYKFLCSQAAQYQWVKNMAPKLYERIKEKIKSGQWEVTGSMWVEADCNLSSGESLIRQILHGKNFFKEEFGIETKDLWLPDVFGYAASLPQILQKSGIDRFLTQKISWNQFNKFPHHTFLWQGIDGTKIFSHFLPVDTYNAAMTPKELAYNVRNFKDNDRAVRSLYVFGHGDGGGGPTIEMLENASRLKNVEGMPMVTLEKAGDFFEKAMAEATDLPLWVGELYLEYHRGTYTTQARNKRNNRKSEFALRDAEFLSAIRPAGLAAYPSDTLDKTWKTVLLNQFHDIIPGSSINEVYRDSDQDYEEVFQTTGTVIQEALDDLAGAVNTLGMKRPIMVISSLSCYMAEVVSVPLKEGEKPAAALDPEGEITPVQIETRPDGSREALFIARNVPMHGYGIWDLGATTIAPETEETVTVTRTSLENEALRAEFDASTGLITRLYDKITEREVMEPTTDADGNLILEKCANRFRLFEDMPVDWDAWDIDLYYLEKELDGPRLQSMEVREWGPVRGALTMTYLLGKSRITQTVSLGAESTRLDFDTEIDWQEERKLLKTAFPVAINSPRATYEVQYGHVERPTHFNTSWDMARFESCAQKWADFSEGDYGVAILNDCKYGHDIHDGIISLTLLRSPKDPDPMADMGSHRFLYSLLPHEGGLAEGEVAENSYVLNAPFHVVPLPANRKGSLPVSRSYFELDRGSVFIECIKKAEHEEALIVRLCEAHNTRGKARLITPLPIKSASFCDLLENDTEPLIFRNGEADLFVNPFEIVTIKLRLQ